MTKLPEALAKHHQTSPSASALADSHHHTLDKDALFRHAAAPAQSDFDVARGQHATETLEARYDSWICDRVLNTADLMTLDPNLPIYLGDCWRTEQYADYIKSTPHSSPLVLDHHLYRCFTSSDISTPAPDHTRSLTDESAHTSRMFSRVAEKLSSAGGGLVVGEWSGALNPGSITGAPDEVKNYAAAQLSLYEKHYEGYFFWTYKKLGLRPDRGWCLRDAVEGGIFPSRVGLLATRRADGDRERQVSARDKVKVKALGEHTAYWSKYPGRYQHSRFADGFAVGWNDAYMFFASSSSLDRAVSELGFVGARSKNRTEDQGSSFWEFRTSFPFD
ncbi:glycoside hydrolase superfamily [Mycena sp. CBHHK59/15]|nr:glycoside hydrolase superfamily [Mycena sp. CBHHK59/15]